MSVKKLSVVTIVAVILVTITTVLVVSFAAMNFISMKNKEESRLHDNLTFSAEDLSSSLTLPVWNFDAPQIRRIIEISMQERNIQSIVVKAGEKIYAVSRDLQWNAIQSDGHVFDQTLLRTERTITYGNESLGSVIVYVTPRFMNQYLRNALINQSIAIVLLDLVLVLSLYLLLWKIVLKPLKKIEQYFVDENSTSRTNRSLDNFRFYGELDNVMRSIEKMMSLLDSRYNELQQTNEMLRTEIGERLEKEEALLISKSILRKIIDTIPQTVFWKDNDLKYLGCNNSFARQTGLYAIDDILGKTDYDLPWPKKESDAYRRDDIEVLQTKQAKMHIIEPLQQSDGKRFWVDTCKVPLFSSDGKISGVLGVYEDITERKNAEDKLRESEERYRTMFENAPVGIFYSTVNGKILSVNNEYAEMLGYSSPEEIKEIVNRTTIAETIYVHTEERTGVLEQTTAIPGSWIKSEKQFRKKDGTEITAIVIIRALPNNPDNLEGFLEDITERKQAEDALRESEGKLRAMFESSRDAIGVATRGKHIFANSSYLKLFGFEKNEDIIGSSVLDSIAPSSRAQLIENVTNRSEGKPAPVFYEARCIRTDGSEFDAEFSVSTYELDGEIYSLATIRDITKRKLTEEALRENEERMKAIVEGSPNFFFYVQDANANIIYVSPTVEQITGYNVDSWLNQKNWFLTDAKFNQDAIEKTRAHLRGEFTEGLTLIEIHHANGNPILLEGYEYPIIRNGNVVGVQGVVHDITDRKRAEEALQKSEELFRKLLMTVPEVIIKTDLEGNILFVNETSFPSFGYVPKDKISGKNILSFVHNEDLERAIENTKLMFEKPLGFKEYLLKFDEDIEIYCEVNGEILRDAENNPFGIVYVIRDITERKKAEDALRENEERYRTMIEILPDGVAIITGEKVVFINDVGCKILHGDRKEDFLEKSVNDFVLSENLELARKRMLETISENKVGKIIETVYIGIDGIPVDVLTTMAPFNYFGKTSLLIVFKDNTERKRSENELKELKDRFQTVFTLSPLAISIATLSDRCYVDINQRFTEMTGWTREEVLGKPSSQFNLWVDRSMSKNFHDTLLHDKVLRNFETPIKTKDGLILYNSLSVSIIDLNGIPHIIIISQDITDRKKAVDELNKYKDRLLDMVEERTIELEQSRETFRALAENTKDVITRVNERFQFLYMNSAMKDVLGIQANDYIGKTLDNFDFSKNLVERFKIVVSKVFDTKQNRHAEFQLPNGIWADLLAMPEFDINGNVCSVIISTRDITEHKKLQHELEKALEKEKELNQLKNRFISMVSHEYRTPLTSILSSIEILEMGGRKYSEENKIKHFDRIQKNIDFMINMIDEVLYVNRIDSERVKLSYQITDLEKLCREIFIEIKELYPGIKSKIEINLDEKKYNMDEAIMKKILGNLVLNAFKYNIKNGKVDFIINSEIDKLIFKIIDTGIGIPEEEQKNVFEPFIRMTNSQNIKGTGLGLSIVKKSVEQIGGSVTFQSKIDEGTTFIVTLPIT